MVEERPVETSLPSTFTVGDWLVQPNLGRISQGDRVVRVRPQLMDLLVVLASRPGQPFSKPELLGALWARHEAGETGLLRCVAELRQLLGDDAQQPTYIETISKRGYRLIAPVTAAAVAGGPRWSVPAVGGGAPDRVLPGLDSSTVGSAPPVGDSARTADFGAADHPRMAVGPGGESLDLRGSPRAGAGAVRAALGTSRTWWVGAVLVALVAVAVFVVRHAARAGSSTSPHGLLLVFENATGDTVFDETLRLALALELEQSPSVRTVSEQRVRDELVFMRRDPDVRLSRTVALDLCQRVGARAVVAGSIGAHGARYVIGIESIACRDGRVLARHQVQVARREDVLSGLGEAAAAVRQRLVASMASMTSATPTDAPAVPLVQATTSSLDALEAFSRGDLERRRGRDDQAISAYQQAIALDPDFALAYGRLGVHLLNLGRTGEAAVALSRAFDLRDRVSAGERLYITAFHHSRVVRDPFRAVRALEAWAATYPGNPLARFSLAAIYGHVGRFAESLAEGRAALRLDPGNTTARVVVIESLMRLGRVEQARAQAERLVSASPGSVVARVCLMQAAFALGDAGLVRRQIEWAEGVPAAEAAFAARRTAMALFGGRIAEASRLARRGAELAEQRGDAALAGLILADLAVALALAELPDEAAALTCEALGRSRSGAVVSKAALAFAAAGRADDAERLLGEHAHLADVQVGSDPESRVPAIATLLLRRGDGEAAIENLAPLRRHEAGARFQFLPAYVRGLAHLRGGRSREAAAEFARIVANRGALADAPIYPLACLQLGRARAAQGERSLSRAAFDRFLRFWSEADSGIPLVGEAQRGRNGR